MKHLFKVICVTIVCVSPRIVPADSPPDDLAAAKKRIAELEGEVKSLQARIRQLEATEQKGVGVDANSATVAKAAKTFHSALDILRELPKELQPRTDAGWDKYSIGRAEDWIKTQPIGESFNASLQVASVEIGHNPAWHNSHSQPEWEVRITLETQDRKYSGVALTEAVGGKWPQPLHLFGEEAFARSAEKLRKGATIQVAGKIAAIYLGPEDHGRRRFHIGLSDYSVESPLLKQ